MSGLAECLEKLFSYTTPMPVIAWLVCLTTESVTTFIAAASITILWAMLGLLIVALKPDC